EQRFEEPAAQRIDHYRLDQHVRSGNDQSRGERKSGGRRIRRHPNLGRLEIWASLESDPATNAVVRLDSDARAEMREHLLGVVARRLAFDDDRPSRRIKTGEQDG